VPAGGRWVVRARIRNAGTGTMPVEVAAVRGLRFSDPKQREEPYRDARVTVNLGPQETQTAVIACDFEPERVLADPDFKVLQLERNKATAKVTVERPRRR
jgi:hypothetical protein